MGVLAKLCCDAGSGSGTRMGKWERESKTQVGAEKVMG